MRFADANFQIACVEFDIFVALNTLHFNIPGGDADKEIRVPGHLDGDGHIVVRAASDAQFAGIVGALETGCHISGVAARSSADVDGNLVLICPDNMNLRRPDMETKLSARGEISFQTICNTSLCR